LLIQCSHRAVVDVFGSDVRLFSSATAFCNDYLASKTTTTTTVIHTVFSTHYPILSSLASPASPTAQAAVPTFPYLTSPAAQAPSAILFYHCRSDSTNTQAPWPPLITSFSPSSRSAACSCLVSPTSYTIVQTVLAPEETQWVVHVEVQEKLPNWHAEEGRKWNTEESRKWPYGKGAEMVTWDEMSDGMEVRTP